MPVSRWSRPITIGARTLPFFTSQLNRRPISGALAVLEPADARGKTLELHALLGLLDPAGERCVAGKRLEHGPVGLGDVGRVARERRPAERPGALAEERPDERGHEARNVERLRHGPVVGHLAPEVVAVVEHDGAAVA